MIKERQVKLLCILTPKDYEFTHNKNGFFFQKEGKNLKWCISYKDALDFLKLIRNDREKHWWESDDYINEFI
jgi:hypothetical protein